MIINILLLLTTILFLIEIINASLSFEKRLYYSEGGIFTFGLFLAITAAMFLALFTLGTWKKSYTIDDQIKYLEEYNQTIDSEIDILVKEYFDYEKEIQGKSISPSLLIEMYPELKANALVEKRIDLLAKNEEELRKLELERIDLTVDRKIWYPFFMRGK